MSNRQRIRQLSPETRRVILTAAQCPDCNSEVRLRAGVAEIVHDDSCPSLAQLRRQRRTVQAALVPTPDTDVASVLRAVDAIAAKHGLRMRIATSPYAGLHHDNRRKAS